MPSWSVQFYLWWGVKPSPLTAGASSPMKVRAISLGVVSREARPVFPGWVKGRPDSAWSSWFHLTWFLRPPEERWVTDINTDPSCIWITNLDMALGSSLGPENIIVLNGSPSHSDQDDARRNMTLDTNKATGCGPNTRLHLAFESNIGHVYQHRPLSCGRTMALQQF